MNNCDYKYECNFCSKKFKSHFGHKKHMTKKHQINNEKKIKIHTCKHCNVFKHRQSKWYHEQKCNGEKEITTKIMQNEIKFLKSELKKTLDETTDIKFKYLTNEINNLKNNSFTNNNQIITNEMNNTSNNKNIIKITQNLSDYFLNNFDDNLKSLNLDGIYIDIYDNNYVDISNFFLSNNYVFDEWTNIKNTKQMIINIKNKYNLYNNDIIKKDNNKIIIHPELAIYFFELLNPINSLKFQNFILTSQLKNANNEIIKKDKLIDVKNQEIDKLYKGFVKKQTSTSYPNENVIYLLTTEFHKKK